MNKYKAVILDDYEQVRNLLIRTLCLNDFDVRGYSQAEKLLSEVFEPRVPLEELPDLVVVDLQLEPNRMQGMELISELAERSVPSEILVISGSLSDLDMEEAFKLGAATGLSKPFDDFFGAIRKMEALAETGRKRRLYRISQGSRTQQMDSTRIQRPVFLSYSTQDKKLAGGLRRNLDLKSVPVWYAPTTIPAGDPWRARIEEGIDRCRIFVALVTENYVNSDTCMAEVARFHRRLIGPDPRPLILPVLAGISDHDKKESLLKGILDSYQWIDVSTRFVDGLTVLLGRIQSVLGEQRVGVRERKRPFPSVA